MRSMRFHFLIKIIVFLLPGVATAQLSGISGSVYDALNEELLPFVSVSKTRDNKGTITDFNGNFTLKNVNPGDTVRFYYIGYKPAQIVVGTSVSVGNIYLEPEELLFDEVVVLADNRFLYELISDAAKRRPKGEHTSKTYFELETFEGDDQLELFQGYYNGVYRGYDVKDLQMKNAHFAVAPMNKRIFASTETSKAMYLQRLSDMNSYFPSSPFEYRKRQLKKKYSLTLSSKYKNEQDEVIYVINFKPRDTIAPFFSGKVWIDSLSRDIHKVRLQIEDTPVHPFRPFWLGQELRNVNLDIRKTFEKVEGEMRIKSVDFDYNLIYSADGEDSLNIETRAVLWAYNYNEAFDLPLFRFVRTTNDDYRRIQMLPADSRFWECNDEFQVESNSEERLEFLKDSTTINSQELFRSDTIFRHNFFESPYVTWKGNRVLLKGISEDSAAYYEGNGVILSRRYNLDVQFFVDVNELCDSTQLVTATIFDPYSSYFHFNIQPHNQVFINIYFDLMEMERRKLHEKLLPIREDREKVKEEYRRANETARRLSESYFKEVERGTNLEALQKWNEIICNELHIDNMYLFGIAE